jgi:ADP-ribose pyrophosphatase YjhB (NUDIX family)
MVHDVFQKGLIRGTENLPFDPSKAYFYVEHPTEGWRVYLRSCCFIHEKPSSSLESNCIDPMRFVVVKKNGAPINSSQWEPPKGQMEGKDGVKNPRTRIMTLLTENVEREVAEESRIKVLQGLRHTGMVFENAEKNYPPNTFFQYHIFQGLVTTKEWMRASAELEWYREHPAAFARLKRDKREKDMIQWYSPRETRIMGRWSAQIVAMYLKAFA